jgi:hypothetical protein
MPELLDITERTLGELLFIVALASMWLILADALGALLFISRPDQ